MEIMKRQCIFFLLCFMYVGILGCRKDFLDERPDTRIVSPTSLDDIQNLLDNSFVLNINAALPLLASDEYYYIDLPSWEAAASLTERNSYSWASDIYGGEVNIRDWNDLYSAVFYANNVLENLSEIEVNDASVSKYKNLQGVAFFFRAWAFFDLVENFAPAYDDATANTDLGIPLRLEPGIDYTLPRSSVRVTYDQVIADLNYARQLISTNLQGLHKNRPSQAAVMAFFARIYLSMRHYDKAELYADSCLVIQKDLINYNSISTTSITPFLHTNNNEVIFAASQIPEYSVTSASAKSTIAIDSNVIDSYDENDLRIKIFYRINTNGKPSIKRGYSGATSLYPFSGLATDEMYLIKAECLARRNQVSEALSTLDSLLNNRFKTGTYVPSNATDSEEALSLILKERGKELIWRNRRWFDLKRLNREGRVVTLKRTLGGQEYTLSPNDKRYVFPIPQDEINLSGIEQNIR